MNRFKTYAFWVALSSAIVILIQNIGKLFGFEVESGIIESLIMSICGILVVLGIVTKSSEEYNIEVSKKEQETEIVDEDLTKSQNSDNVNFISNIDDNNQTK